jgi:hypothetical protein
MTMIVLDDLTAAQRIGLMAMGMTGEGRWSYTNASLRRAAVVLVPTIFDCGPLDGRTIRPIVAESGA